MTSQAKTKAQIEQDRQKLHDELENYPYNSIEIYYTLTDKVDPATGRTTAVNIQPWYTDITRVTYRDGFCKIETNKLTELDHSNLPPQVIAASELLDNGQYYAKVSIKSYLRQGEASLSFGFVDANPYEKFRIDKINEIANIYEWTKKGLDNSSNEIETRDFVQEVIKEYKKLLDECNSFMGNNLANMYLDHFRVREIIKDALKDLERLITKLNRQIDLNYEVKIDYIATNQNQIRYHHKTKNSSAHSVIKKTKFKRNKTRGFGSNLGFIFDINDYFAEFDFD